MSSASAVSSISNKGWPVQASAATRYSAGILRQLQARRTASLARRECQPSNRAFSCGHAFHHSDHRAHGQALPNWNADCSACSIWQPTVTSEGHPIGCAAHAALIFLVVQPPGLWLARWHLDDDKNPGQADIR